jgi:hypothetical protein
MAMASYEASCGLIYSNTPSLKRKTTHSIKKTAYMKYFVKKNAYELRS